MSRACRGAAIATIVPRPDPTWREAIRTWHADQLETQSIQLQRESPNTLHGHAPIQQSLPKGARKRWRIHPGSGGAAKCWPIVRFAELARILMERGDEVAFLLGPAERERGVAEKLKAQQPDAVLHEVREIDDLCFALRDATHYLGNDAGPTHLAAQLGLPTTALFGPTDPRVWAPVGPSVQVVAPDHTNLITWLSVETLLRRLDVQ